MTVDYETVETALGDKLRACDNYDLDHAHFFPIGFIDRLFHFAQDLSVVEHRHDEKREVTTSGDDFDRWVDDMVSGTILLVRTAPGAEPVEARLIDVLSLDFASDGTVTAEMAEGGTAQVMLDADTPLLASGVDDLNIAVEEAYERQSSPLRSLEYLASMFFRAGRSLKINICNQNRDLFIEPIFKFFKFDLVPMINDLQEDLEQIADEQLLTVCLC